jgi:hypothetical protein
VSLFDFLRPFSRAFDWIHVVGIWLASYFPFVALAQPQQKKKKKNLHLHHTDVG